VAFAVSVALAFVWAAGTLSQLAYWTLAIAVH